MSVKIPRNSTSFPVQLSEHLKKVKLQKYEVLSYYQNLVRDYVGNVKYGGKGLLVYHEMGVGKSILASALAIDNLKKYRPIMLMAKSLQRNMYDSIKKYIKLRSQVDPKFLREVLKINANLTQQEEFHDDSVPDNVDTISQNQNEDHDKIENENETENENFDHRAGQSEKNVEFDQQIEKWIDQNFSFVSMNAGNMLKQMGNVTEGSSSAEFDKIMEDKFGEILKLGSLKGVMLLIDEAHNFFRAITNGSKNAIGLYNMIVSSEDCISIFLTGTPSANHPFELSSCFNMLAGEAILPEDYREFCKLFIDSETGLIKNKEYFQNRIFGLVSRVTRASQPLYAEGPSSSAKYPQELPIKVEKVAMDDAQFVTYQLAREKEKEESQGPGGRRDQELPSMTKPKNSKASTYRVRSRQISNFCPPGPLLNEKNPKNIPPENLDSAKYRRILHNIDQHPNQLGIAYSQFTGMGGLGTFARFLEKNGWEKIEISQPSIKSKPKSLLEEATKNDDPSPAQEEPSENVVDSVVNSDDGQDDIDGSIMGGYVKPNRKVRRYLSKISDKKLGHFSAKCGGDSSFYNSNPPSIDEYLSHLEKEGQKHSGSWWGSNEFVETTLQDEFTKIKSDDLPNFEQSNALPKIRAVRYATTEDLPRLTKKKGSNFDPTWLTKPFYTIILDEKSDQNSDGLLAYVVVESKVGEYFVKEENFNQLPENVNPDIIYSAIMDTVDKIENRKVKSDIVGGIDISQVAQNKKPGSLRKFAVISGDVPVEDRARLQEMYNSADNIHGSVIDLLLISSTGAEGLDLKNCCHVHIIEPYWTYGRILQIIARAVRSNSHIALSDKEAIVQPYIYLAVPPPTAINPDEPTTDTELYDESLNGMILIRSFEEALSEVSIECILTKDAKCRTCMPTGQKLFTDDILKDLRRSNPCAKLVETQVEAKKITVDGVEYHFIPDDRSIFNYKIFVYDTQLNAHKPMLETNPLFEKIAAAIDIENQ